ncbi:hypothetical protein M758_5G143800 [Ceratodon purpureus]|nr:hypothetical protein M758_5G143800 [Ceratodon purpureus]
MAQLKLPMEVAEDVQEAGFLDPLGANSAGAFAGGGLISKSGTSRAAQRLRKGPASDEHAQAVAAEWDVYKSSVMQRFASTGTITVTTGLDILSKEPKGHKKSVTAAHLEQLEDSDKDAREGSKIISQQEYVTRLRELNDEIALAWLNNERVAALRLTIKVARLLMDTSVPQFYPTLFVLVTDVMDTVGNLVWDRIKRKSEGDESDELVALLPANFTADDVRPEAKETCNNWFYKIGCIREVLPRIYLEIAILRCTVFLEKDPAAGSIQRLTLMMRGISDPLASAYAHLYLARRGQVLLPPDSGDSEVPTSYGALSSFLQITVPLAVPRSRGYLINGLNDYLFLFRRVLYGDFDKKIAASGVDRRLYVTLVEPVFEWIMKCIFEGASQDEMAFVVHAFGEPQPLTPRRRGGNAGQPDQEPVSVIVHYMLKQLPPAYIAGEALNMLRMIKSSKDVSLSQHLNYKLLGEKLCECSPPRENQLVILNEAWKVVMTYSNLPEYMAVADVFLDYILQYCTEMELTVLLKDILKHFRNGDISNAALVSLESIIFKLVTHYTDITKVLNLVHVVDILDLFDGEIRLSVYKRILASVTRSNQKISDPVTRHIVFEQCRVLHDSLDSLSSEDDRRQITRLIARFVQLVDYGLDLEQHLAFLVDCRATFGNMDLLRETVVHSSNRLSVSTLKLAGGLSNKQTIEFVKACVTFNAITIPSITSIISRIHLFLETAEAAFMNGLLSHTEDLVKTALKCLQDSSIGDGSKQKEFEEAICSFLQKLLSFLTLAPGHPELGAFYILRGILTLLDTRPKLVTGRRRLQVLCGVVCMLSAVREGKCLHYSLNEQVDGNDILYFEDPLYEEELAEITAVVVDMLVTCLDQDDDKAQRGYQHLDACNALVTAFKVDGDLKTLCTGLLQKASAVLTETDAYLQVTTRCVGMGTPKCCV